MTSTDQEPAPEDAGWTLARDAAQTDVAARLQEESLFALADGVLGVRGGAEELEGVGGVFLNAVFDRTPIVYHERFPGFARASDTRVPVADPLGVQIEVGGVRLAREHLEAAERRLDLRTGELVRRARYRCAAGMLEIEASRVVSGGGLMARRLSLRSIDVAAPVRLTAWLAPGRAATPQSDDPRFGAGQGAALRTLHAAVEGAKAALLQAAQHGERAAACAVEHHARGAALEAAASGVAGGAARIVFAGDLAPGGSIDLETVAAYAPGTLKSAETGALAHEAARRIAGAAVSTLRRAAKEELAAFWRSADVHAGEDAALGRALRFNLLQLRQSAPQDGLTGLAAKGLTGEGYEGHTFWDSEAFALPVLALTAPERALSQLRFRVRTLDRARVHARELNFAAGALYPWRTIAGDEGSAYFLSGSAQLHINADIADAVRVYDRASGDDAFVLGEAAEMVWETARIWLQAGAFDARLGGAFRICGVTGPDEYSALVDDDHFTNRMARRHLRFALELARRADRHAPCAPDAEEQSTWARAAETMHLPVDPTLGVHLQDAAFLDKAAWVFREDRADRPLLLHYHPLTLYRHQVIKQASVVQAHAQDPQGAGRAQKRRDLNFYTPRTAHDSTLSAAAHAVVAAAVGQAAQALGFLRASVLVDLDDLHGNAAHGLHMAAMAGGWQALAMGFAGLTITGDGGLDFLPQAPAGLPRYGFGLVWRGARLRVEVDGPTVLYALAAEGPALTLRHDGVVLSLRPGEAARRPTLVIGDAPKGRIQGLAFDLDGVLTDTARAHYTAWKAIADALGAPFDETVNEALKGVDRMGSLDLILATAPRAVSSSEREALAARKNAHYGELISHFGPGDLLPGARAALELARARALPTALASASRNAPELLARLGVAHLFDAVVDPTSVSRGKPDPAIFLAAARALHVAPKDCLAFEDARAGVAAIKAAGMTAVGIGDAQALRGADVVAPDLASVDWERLLA